MGGAVPVGAPCHFQQGPRRHGRVLLQDDQRGSSSGCASCLDARVCVYPFVQPGPLMTRLLSAPHDDVRQHGGWSEDIMLKHYASWLPIGAMKAIALFSALRASYFVVRQAIQLPESMLPQSTCVNADLDRCKARMFLLIRISACFLCSCTCWLRLV